MTTEEMLARLEVEIELDAGKMFRWRQIHRAVACIVTLTLIALPVMATMKELEGREHFFLFALTVIAAYEGLFRPAVHSARRRDDAADMTDLLWEFRSALIATPETNAALRLAVHDKFRQRYQALFRARGRALVDFSLAQHENDMAARADTRPAGHTQHAAADSADPGTVNVSPGRLIALPEAAPTAKESRSIEPVISLGGAAGHA